MLIWADKPAANNVAQGTCRRPRFVHTASTTSGESMDAPLNRTIRLASGSSRISVDALRFWSPDAARGMNVQPSLWPT